MWFYRHHCRSCYPFLTRQKFCFEQVSPNLFAAAQSSTLLVLAMVKFYKQHTKELSGIEAWSHSLPSRRVNQLLKWFIKGEKAWLKLSQPKGAEWLKEFLWWHLARVQPHAGPQCPRNGGGRDGGCYQVAAAVSMEGQSSLHSCSALILGQLECSLQMPTKLEIKTSKSSRPHSNTLFSVPYGTSTILGKQLYKITRATEIHYNLCIISV